MVGEVYIFSCLKGAWISGLVIGGCDGLVQAAAYASYVQAEGEQRGED